MKFKSILFTAMLSALAACGNGSGRNHYQMDYPIDAARLSISGNAEVTVNCATKEVKILSDSSNGVFSRHIQKRVYNICYMKNETLNIVYQFNPATGVRQNMLATHFPRVPPESNANKASDRDS